MKTITKTILIITLLFTSLYINAQYSAIDTDSPPKVSAGIRVGLNLSNLMSIYADGSYYEKIKAGYNAGVVLDFHLTKDFYLRTGLSASAKGAKVEDFTYNNTTYIANMNAIYLQMPLYFTYKKELEEFGSNLVASVSGGPYVAYGIAGKCELKNDNGIILEEMDTFDKDWIWNRPDVGLGCEIGLEIQKLVLTIGFDFGFANAWKGKAFEGNPSVSNSTYYASMGYNF